MAACQFTYCIAELPDPAYPQYQLKAGGDVQAAVQADAEQLLRALAAFEPDSISVAIRLVYEPSAGDRALQERLVIYVVGHANSEETGRSLSLLLSSGPLNRFYELRPIEDQPVDWGRFSAACDAIRSQTILRPTVPPELNSKALPAYLLTESLQPRRDSDYLPLDSVLNRLDEPAMIEMCVEPADVAPELAEHTGYLARLQQVNRTWEPEEDDLLNVAWDRGRTGSLSGGEIVVKPLRQKDPLVDDILRRQQRFHETLTQRHLRFHIRTFAQSRATVRLLTSVVAESALEEGTYQLFDSASGDRVFDETVARRGRIRAVPVPTAERLTDGPTVDLYHTLGALTNLAPVGELISAVRLPIASYGSPYCIRKNTDPPCDSPEDLIVLGHDQLSGDASTASGAPPVPRGIRVDRLTKHMFICGMTGAGKTTLCQSFLRQLAARCIPFIVLEPAKTDYRVLKCLGDHADPDIRRLAREMRVYTPGCDDVSPLRINPLQIPEGISQNEHIENLLSCFKASMPMSGPLPALLGEALERVFESHLDADDPPRMADLHAAARDVLAAKGYSGDVDSDIRAALEVRLGTLTRRAIGRVFQCERNVPTIGQLMTGWSLVELAALPQEQACLLTLFILTILREHVRVTPNPGRGGRLVLFLEEAHNIVGSNNEASASEENADPRAFASQFICLMLAELRALGVAIVVVDQLPSAVAAEVLKNTGTKATLRGVHVGDREAIGGAMLFGPIEFEEVARLGTGEAFIHTEGYFGPRRIQCPNLHAELDLPDEPVGEALRPYLSEEPWYADAATARIEAELEHLRRQMDQFETERTQVAKQAAQLVAKRVQILGADPATRRSEQLAALASQAQCLHSRLESALDMFARDVYRPLVGSESPEDITDECLRTLRSQLTHRFRSIIEPDTRSCLSLVARLHRDLAPRSS